MKAVEAKLLSFLKKSPQFVIPIYQRTYSWGVKECEQLWDDILRTGSNKDITAHFVGSIVYVEKGLYNVSTQSPLLVIDGQQRLTTVMLIIEALARTINGSEPVEGFTAQKLREYYLINPLEEEDKKFKLILSETDKDSLISIIENKSLPNNVSLRIDENFRYFIERIEKEKNNLEVICEGLAKLIVVDISLNRDQDNPQLIFESLNSTGRELSQADLIRNYILMGQEQEVQTKLYNDFWRPMEIDFGQEGYSNYFDSFMRHYLTVKTGTIPKESEVYEAFKKYSQTPEVTSFELLVSDIRNFAKFYCYMALGTEIDPDLKMAFQDLRELKVDVAFPLLLELYNDYDKKIINSNEFLEIVRLIESYVFRRAVCSIPTNSMNKTFANFSRDLKKDKYIESVKAAFLLLPSYRRFPEDDEFKRELKSKDLYNFRSRSYWLRRLENFDRKERIIIDEYTIEHIMPQNDNLSVEWQTELGTDWKRIHDTYLNSLGNLTLTRYNSEYSDRPFIEKKNMNGGFAVSPLKLNKDISQREHWREEDILERAELLSDQAVVVWSMPSLNDEILSIYKTKVKSDTTEYTIEDHPYLSIEPIKTLFEELRKQIMALDPCVTETFFKPYVAYKAETNFVDIVPQSRRLRLTLNLPFTEIIDTKGLCINVANKGHWGNGEVEVGISTIEEIPYIMGLIRQSLDRQIGDMSEDQYIYG